MKNGLLLQTRRETVSFLRSQNAGNKNKSAPAIAKALYGAVNQIRTGDLVLTKDVLYHLSHNSIFILSRVFALNS